MDHYPKMTDTNPNTTFKEALRAAAPLYREQKDNLFTVRGHVVNTHRQKARAVTGVARQALEAKADRVEAQRYGSVLRNINFEYTYGSGLFEDELEWGKD